MDTGQRTLITSLVLSAAGLIGIAAHEGYTDRAIPDPVKGAAVPTIGFGSTGGVKMGDTTTPPAALRRALTDLGTYETAIKRCVTVPLYQREYDAYVNLTYNIGGHAFCKSRIVRLLNKQDYSGACAAIIDWRYVGATDCSKLGNRTCPGLWQRRKDLRAQCLGEGTAR